MILCLQKRFPNPKEELPIMNNTILNSEVKLIYNDEKSDKVIVTTQDAIYSANHVIVTVSLGVLKEKHTRIFYPPLPNEKIKTINVRSFIKF